MLIRAKGILHHRFHGTYSAVITLEFPNESDARTALEVLGKDWEGGKEHKNILVALFDGEGVEQFKTKYLPKCLPCNWKQCKGKIHEIDGVNHSVDIGSPFELSIEISNKNQLNLF